MRNIVVLGAGTGGCIVANMLSHKLNQKEWKITVIDKAAEHHYQPGNLFIPFKLYGYETREQIARDITDPLPKSADFIKAEVKLIDHKNKKVVSTRGSHDYDYLVVALGCQAVVDEVEGLPETYGKNGVHSFYHLDAALAMQPDMEKMESGKLVIDIADMPIKCPVAPIEFAFLADYYFALKGVRDKIDISLVTPYSGAFTKPNANRVLTKIAWDKHIHIVPNFALERVDGENHSIHSYEGTTVEYDLLCIIPPNLGPRVIDDSGLGDGTGYALTDPKTLKHRKADFIYLLGDNTNVSTSKAGSVAHFEAETVVENILAGDRRQEAAAELRRALQLLHRVRLSQGPADRLQLRHGTAGRQVPHAGGRAVRSAEGNLHEPHGQDHVRLDLLEHAPARLPADGADAALADEFRRQGHEHASQDPAIPGGEGGRDHDA